MARARSVKPSTRSRPLEKIEPVPGPERVIGIKAVADPAEAYAFFIETYRDKPVEFVEDILGIKTIQVWQKAFLRAVARGERRISVRAGHGVGKSAACSWALIWFFVTRYPQKSVCLAGDVRVLTDRGPVSIVAVAPDDLVWDGVEWVRQDGPICNGWRETIELAGVRLTPRHEILSGTTWHPAAEMALAKSILSRALETASASLRSPDFLSGSRAASALAVSSCAAPAAARNTGHRPTICVRERLLAACSAAFGALSRHASNTPATAMSLPMMQLEPAWSGASTAFGGVAMSLRTAVTRDMGGVASASGGTNRMVLARSGSATKPSGDGRCLNIWSRWKVGISPALNLIASIMTRAMSPETCASQIGGRTPTIADRYGSSKRASGNSKTKLPVYDLVNCGPRSRFTILSDQGPLIVHNCTAPTASQLFDALFSEVKKWVGALPPPVRDTMEIFSDRIVHKSAPESSFITARTSSKEKPEAIAGIHEENVLIICDEASAIPEEVYEAAAGSMSGHNATTILISNPTRNSGLFFRTHHDLKSHWHTMHVSCVGNPLVTPDFINQIANTYGPDSNRYRVRVLGEFATAEDDVLIAAELVDAAMIRDVFHNVNEPLKYGLDVARFGDDRSALVKRQGNVVLEVKSWHGNDLMETVGRVVNEAKQDKPVEICVDSIGVGGGVADRLRELKFNVRDVNVAEASAMNPEAAKLRDELWLSLRDWFKTRAVKIPNNPDLRQEICSPTYTYLSNGKTKVEGKPEMKKRGLRSPDLADALCLSFAGEAAAVGGRITRWIPGQSLKRNLRGVV